MTSEPQSLAALLDSASASGVHRWSAPSVSHTDLQEARAAGWTVAVVELVSTSTKATMLHAFQNALRFPTWFGHNWDALADALPDWVSATDRKKLLVVEGPMTSDAARTMVDILTDFAQQPAAGAPRVVVLLATRSGSKPDPASPA